MVDSPEENQSALCENQSVAEVVNIDHARFSDKLDPEFEAGWSKILQLVLEASGPDGNEERADQLKSIWHDSDMPRVIQDRAILTLLGGYRLDDEQRPFNGIFSLNPFDPYSLQFTPEEELELDSWYVELLDYTEETGQPTLTEYHRLAIAARYFDRGEVSRSMFESVLDQADFSKTHCVIDTRGEEVDTDYIGSRLDRLTVLQDIYSSFIGDRRGSRDTILAWANEQVSLLLDYKEGGVEFTELPDWLRSVGVNDGNLNRLVDNLLINSPKGPRGIDYSTCLKAINIYGWGILKPDGSAHIGKKSKFKLSLNDITRRGEVDDPNFDNLLEAYLKQYFEEYKLAESGDRLEEFNGDIFYRKDDDTLSLLRDKFSRTGVESELGKMLDRTITQIEQYDEQKRLLYEAMKADRKQQSQETALKKENLELERAQRMEGVAIELSKLIDGFKSIT